MQKWDRVNEGENERQTTTQMNVIYKHIKFENVCAHFSKNTYVVGLLLVFGEQNIEFPFGRSNTRFDDAAVVAVNGFEIFQCVNNENVLYASGCVCASLLLSLFRILFSLLFQSSLTFVLISFISSVEYAAKKKTL